MSSSHRIVFVAGLPFRSLVVSISDYNGILANGASFHPANVWQPNKFATKAVMFEVEEYLKKWKLDMVGRDDEGCVVGKTVAPEEKFSDVHEGFKRIIPYSLSVSDALVDVRQAMSLMNVPFEVYDKVKLYAVIDISS